MWGRTPQESHAFHIVTRVNKRGGGLFSSFCQRWSNVDIKLISAENPCLIHWFHQISNSTVPGIWCVDLDLICPNQAEPRIKIHIALILTVDNFLDIFRWFLTAFTAFTAIATWLLLLINICWLVMQLKNKRVVLDSLIHWFPQLKSINENQLKIK